MAKDAAPQEIRRLDYRPYPYRIPAASLGFDLGEQGTLVTNQMQVEAAPHGGGPMVLDGEDLELVDITLNGQKLATRVYGTGTAVGRVLRALKLGPEAGLAKRLVGAEQALRRWFADRADKTPYLRQEAGKLVIENPPAKFDLSITTRIHPETNTQLSGLYKSGGNFCTQMEAQGFRRVTFWPDRPDVMTRFTTRIEADKARYPVLLGGGNPGATGDLGNGRHFAQWVDPVPKPCYLFALVGADLDYIEDHFTTRSGRNVALRVYAARDDIGSCHHALAALKRTLAWEEQRWGREYHHDVFNVVAVGDFNMGAMENTTLNIFNTKYVLADPETATDRDFMGVDSVIAHEALHYHRGNRVTCRDWFQLTLKEGLTVFSDQEYTSDHHSRAVKRIEDVVTLRASQFPEDGGPTAHPIRPQSYVAIDNFYTATVYEKGAEVIRMLHTMLGEKDFRAGLDLYFDRHDCQPATCEDFLVAMEEASGRDLTQFRMWYDQAGTPEVSAEGVYDAKARTWTLTLSQNTPATPGQKDTFALHIPVRMALLDEYGRPQKIRLKDEPEGAAATEKVVELRTERQTFVFSDVKYPPTPSLLRGFSAPVKLEIKGQDTAQLRQLMMHDGDSFNRWEAGNRYATQTLLGMVDAIRNGKQADVPADFVQAFDRVLADRQLDPSLKALMMSLPGDQALAQKMAVADPDAINQAVRALRQELGQRLKDRFEDLAAFPGGKPVAYATDMAAIGQRAVRNQALGFLAAGGAPEGVKLADTRYRGADNMTDRIAALANLVERADDKTRAKALDAYYKRHKGQALPIDKWFAIQASANRPDTYDRVVALMGHADFSLTNPNRLRALIGGFANNQVAFHRADGKGYRLLADVIAQVDKINPQTAARLVDPFRSWRRFDAVRQGLIEAELTRVLAVDGLSPNTREQVSRILSAPPPAAPRPAPARKQAVRR